MIAKLKNLLFWMKIRNKFLSLEHLSLKIDKKLAELKLLTEKYKQGLEELEKMISEVERERTRYLG